MNSFNQHPGFYRAHPYRHQGDLPDSAFKNRQITNFYSQIPQGKQHFQPSNKKHYQHKYRSQIQEQNVFKSPYPQSLQQMEKSNIVMDRSYFRSLNVDDIQGTKPNTLISKAVKNKQKALIMKKQQINLQNSRKKQIQYKYYQPYQNKQTNINTEQKKYHQQFDFTKHALQKYMKNKITNQNKSMINSRQSSTPNQQIVKNYHYLRNNGSMNLQNNNKIYPQNQMSMPNYNRNQNHNLQRYHNQYNKYNSIQHQQQSLPQNKHLNTNQNRLSKQQQQIRKVQKQINQLKERNPTNNFSYESRAYNNNNNLPEAYQKEVKPSQNQSMINNPPLNKLLIRKYYNPTYLSYESGGIRFIQPITQNSQINNYNTKQRNQRSISLAAKNIVQNHKSESYTNH